MIIATAVTFSVVPDGFYQLYVIHGLYKSNMLALDLYKHCIRFVLCIETKASHLIYLF
jgi:hypothetical protein